MRSGELPYLPRTKHHASQGTNFPLRVGRSLRARALGDVMRSQRRRVSPRLFVLTTAARSRCQNVHTRCWRCCTRSCTLENAAGSSKAGLHSRQSMFRCHGDIVCSETKDSDTVSETQLVVWSRGMRRTAGYTGWYYTTSAQMTMHSGDHDECLHPLCVVPVV